MAFLLGDEAVEFPPEVLQGCKNARELVRLCDVLERRPQPHRAKVALVSGDEPVRDYDPDTDPYFWDL